MGGGWAWARHELLPAGPPFCVPRAWCGGQRPRRPAPHTGAALQQAAADALCRHGRILGVYGSSDAVQHCWMAGGWGGSNTHISGRGRRAAGLMVECPPITALFTLSRRCTHGVHLRGTSSVMGRARALRRLHACTWGAAAGAPSACSELGGGELYTVQVCSWWCCHVALALISVSLVASRRQQRAMDNLKHGLPAACTSHAIV